MKRYPIVFSIASSDCMGGAGTQADIKTVSALGAYAATAITAITVQSSKAIKTVYPLPADIIRQQIEAVMEDIRPDVVRIGAVNDIESVRTIADCLRKYHPTYVVFDFILLRIDGKRIPGDDTIAVIQKELFPFTNLITMSLYEAEALAKMKITTKEELREAAKKLAENIRIPILLKGANLLDNQTYDVVYIPDGEKWEYIAPRLDNLNVLSVSCTFSSAIATFLALGFELNIAVMKAREYLHEAIERGKDINFGKTTGSICHSWNPVQMQIYGND